MSVLIRGIEMPTGHPLWIVVHSDGTVEANEVSASRPVGWQTIRNAAVPVPPHGRLIDANELLFNIPAPIEDEYKYVRRIINDAPTVIPAEEMET